jgi:hypothetical protein
MDDQTKLASLGWLESLTYGKAQVEAGLSVPMEPVLGRLKAAIARMEARQSGPDNNPAQKM